MLQPNIRAGVDFRWVIIALIGGEEVVERLWTGRLVVNRLFIGIWHRDLSPFWKFTANEVIPCRQHALPLHALRRGRAHSFPGKSLLFPAADRNASNDELAEEEVDDDDGENREGNHHIDLPHVELQEVGAAELSNQNRQRLLFAEFKIRAGVK